MPESKRLAAEIEDFIVTPWFFAEIVRNFSTHEYKQVLLAWSELRQEDKLGRDQAGRYVLKQKGT